MQFKEKVREILIEGFNNNITDKSKQSLIELFKYLKSYECAMKTGECYENKKAGRFEVSVQSDKFDWDEIMAATDALETIEEKKEGIDGLSKKLAKSKK